MVKAEADVEEVARAVVVAGAVAMGVAATVAQKEETAAGAHTAMSCLRRECRHQRQQHRRHM